jgi:AraC-like DNA-binding protein
MQHKSSRYGGNITSLLQIQRHLNVECVSHFHEDSELVFVTSGTLTMSIDEREYSIPKGHAVFVPPFTIHEFHSPDFNQATVLIFSNELIPALSNFQKNRQITHHLFPLNEQIFQLLESLLKEQEINDVFKAQAILSLLSLEIKNKCTFIEKKKEFDPKFKNVLVYMQEHFSLPLTLESVAKHFFMHPVTLSKIFKENCKTNFNAHLNYLRSSHAAFLIQNTSLSFTEIAFESGFGSIRNFNRIFQKIYNKSPTEFQEEAF